MTSCTATGPVELTFISKVGVGNANDLKSEESIHTHTHTHTHSHTHTHIHTYIHTYIQIYVYTVYIYACI